MTGAIIAIGGCEDKQGNMTVLKRVCAEAPGRRVHVITTATHYPAAARKNYRDAFNRLGIKDCAVSYINSRAQADDPALAAKIGQNDIIFFSGGDQLRLASILGGTAVFGAIRQAHERGAVIAGTSAGAAALSALMLYDGAVSQAHIKGEMRATAGLGFVPYAVIDTHFTQRGRLPRLFQMAAASPFLAGIGLDEDTALVLRGDHAEAAGSGTVTITGGRAARSDFMSKNIGEAFTITGVSVHKLSPGERYDFKKRAKTSPAGKAPGAQ